MSQDQVQREQEGLNSPAEADMTTSAAAAQTTQSPAGAMRPVSTFTGPIAELIAQHMLAPPARPGVLASVDRFEVLRVLGGGGMGVVLLARDPNTGHEIAIKMIKSDLVSNPQILHRFIKEAGHLQRLRHTNVTPVLEVSDRPQGPYFVMPYFERGSLAKRIQPSRGVESEVVLDIALQIAAGLKYAHQRGIIHRDLKPANILLAANDRACLADFGLAQTMFNDTILDVENQQCEGTAAYMSPAVAAGNAEDTRCDIYSFGVLLYEMLTGAPAYTGQCLKEIRQKILAGPPPSISALNPNADRRLVTVAEGAMARELRDRYADMADVVADLQLIKEGKSPLGPHGKRKRVRQAPAPDLHWFRTSLKILWVALSCAVIVALGWWCGHEIQTKDMARPPLPSSGVRSIITLAGQAGASGSSDGFGLKAQFHLPSGVAVDRVGNVFVADTANNTIRKISSGGLVSTFAGLANSSGSTDGRGGDARFWTPFGVAVDRVGNVYVADTLNNTIRKISPSGAVSTLAGLAGNPGSNDGIASKARFRNPWGVAVDSAGNVYVADSSNHTIRKIAPAGVVSTLAGLPGNSGDADGIGTQARFNNPLAVAVDNIGSVYVTDTANHTIRLITQNGLVRTLAGLPQSGGSTDGSRNNARFWNPQGITVDGAGNVYVADSGNCTLRQITPSGEVQTLAGQPGAPPGSADGKGAKARFHAPVGVAVDNAGNLYVADAYNHTIRMGTAQETRPLSIGSSASRSPPPSRIDSQSKTQGSSTEPPVKMD